MRLPAERKTKDFKTSIIRYLTDESPGALSSEEEKVLARWEHADFLLRQHLEWNDIILKIIAKFSVSKFTAENDIANAQEVFARSRRLNKKYIVHLNLQRIEKFIAFVEKKLFADDELPDAKTIAAVAKLYETHTYTANSIPAEVVKTSLPPPVMNFYLVNRATLTQPMSVEEAIREADNLITDINAEPDESAAPIE